VAARPQGHPDETNLPTLEAPARAQSRLSGAHAHRRRTQGPVGASQQGSRSPLRLTSAPRPRERDFRLRGADAFQSIFRSGRRFDGFFLGLVVHESTRSPGRVGYVISRKSIARAVDRNRLRRRLREVLRAARPAISRFDVIVRVRRPILRAEIDAAVREGSELIARLLAASNT
jgi:ribonuclease P protein component